MNAHLKGFPDLPPIWAFGALIASWGLARILPLMHLRSSLWVGLVFVVLGLALIVWAAWFFFEKATPIMPREEPKHLLIEGPFRINRNPIYSGMLLILVGCAIWFGAFSAWLPVLAFPFVITARFIVGEEAGLRAAFPGEAEAYLRESRRW
ncbi:MAG: isoprenylcysteine carboxylmethyltransferase family protein [Deltaproteobacteria bacterium]